MIHLYSSGRLRDKKMLASAQQMLGDSRAKIEYIRMTVNKVKQRENGLNTESNKSKYSSGNNVFTFTVNRNKY